MDINAILLALGVLGALGIIFGVVLGVADKKFAVKTDPRVEAIRACLGGANCGACGYAGCDAFAEAVVAGGAKPNGCPPGGDKASKAIGEIMGISVESGSASVGRVLCLGTDGVSKERYEYDGIRSCSAAAGLAGGPKMCMNACLGLGDCIDKCVFGAISIKDGVAYIDPKLCKGCGACIKYCPRNAIALMPADESVVVSCRNADVGRAAVQSCMKACIACKRCEKECKYGAIRVEGGYARIDNDKCTRCAQCAKVCPRGCITIY